MAGATRSVCRACSQVFASGQAFDTHRIGTFEPNTRRCMTITEMQEHGMTKDPAGQWRMPQRTRSGQCKQIPTLSLAFDKGPC